MIGGVGTLDFGLHLYASSTTSLVGYTDVDWAGCPSTRMSTSGYCVFLGDNLLSWSAKQQHTLSRSSAEAEYRGVANVVAETAWLRNLLRELHSPLSTATLVYCDNVSAVYMSANVVQHQRTKHIEIDIHFVRDMVTAGQVSVLHIPSRYQYADIFTKRLPTALFKEFRSSLSVRPPPAQTARAYCKKTVECVACLLGRWDGSRGTVGKKQVALIQFVLQMTEDGKGGCDLVEVLKAYSIFDRNVCVIDRRRGKDERKEIKAGGFEFRCGRQDKKRMEKQHGVNIMAVLPMNPRYEGVMEYFVCDSLAQGVGKSALNVNGDVQFRGGGREWVGGGEERLCATERALSLGVRSGWAHWGVGWLVVGGVCEVVLLLLVCGWYVVGCGRPGLWWWVLVGCGVLWVSGGEWWCIGGCEKSRGVEWDGDVGVVGDERRGQRDDVPAYTECFQKLTLICTKFCANETEKINKYIRGLPNNIYGNVKSSNPKDVGETIELASDLMDQKLHTYAEKSDNKRKAEDSSRKNHGHLARDYRSSGNTNVANTHKGNGANPKGNGCFECGAPGTFRPIVEE
ncbi:ribonuclease H-like domain-containing protein [Tanacetum coccineum]